MTRSATLLAVFSISLIFPAYTQAQQAPPPATAADTPAPVAPTVVKKPSGLHLHKGQKAGKLTTGGTRTTAPGTPGSIKPGGAPGIPPYTQDLPNTPPPRPPYNAPGAPNVNAPPSGNLQGVPSNPPGSSPNNLPGSPYPPGAPTNNPPGLPATNTPGVPPTITPGMPPNPGAPMPPASTPGNVPMATPGAAR